MERPARHSRKRRAAIPAAGSQALIQSPEATDLALRIHAEAYRKKVKGTAEDQMRILVRRWRRDGYKGTDEKWLALARMLGE